jgi:hypothetical protein
MIQPSLKLDHAQSFTVREIRTLGTWFTAAQAGDIGTAGRILSTGLLAEHYESLLADDPAARTQEENTILAELSKLADEAITSGGYPL